MKLHSNFSALIVCIALILPHHSQDAQTAFDKCRYVTPADIRDKKAPTFQAYPVSNPPLTGSPKLDLKSSPTARRYRTLLSEEVAKGPNFAGHYRVAIWGCGTSCANFAIVNLATGRVIAPFDAYATGTVYFDMGDGKFFPDSESESDSFGFRKDSKLFMILGDLNEDENREGAFYYVLEGERLRLIHSTPVQKDCENLRGKP
jgi:hypothetical protein